MKKNTQHISQLIKNNVLEIDPDAEVILYGSRARGDARKDSDWDILVLTQYPVDRQREKGFRDHLCDLEIEEPFSVFVYKKKTGKTVKEFPHFMKM